MRSGSSIRHQDKEKTIADYELSAYRSTKDVPEETMWFGERPTFSWIGTLADKNSLSGDPLVGTNVFGDSLFTYDNGHIILRKFPSGDF